MEVDLPEVVAEVREAFERYEQALVSNDVATLDSLFCQDERTIRYGVGENLYGHKEVAAFRAGRSPINLMRTRARTVITTYGRDFAVASTLFHRESLARQGRPADAELGSLRGRVEGGCRARQHHRRAQGLDGARCASATSRRTSVDCRAPTRAGSTRAEVVDHVFAAIEAAGDPGIFISLVDRRAARRAAQKLGRFDPARPLWGIPFAVKDNIDAAGLPTTAGCRAFAYKPKASATAVARLLAAGAILIGKTNLDQFATGLVGVRTPYPVPKNTFDATIVPGGSSSGSAVAVARGLVPFALGTDTAGSGRVPAGLNNIVGLKPSVGAVSNKGVVPACSTLDCVSVFAGTVDDAWAVYAVMAGEDKDDPFSRPIALGRPGAVPPHVVIGIPRAG